MDDFEFYCFFCEIFGVCGVCDSVVFVGQDFGYYLQNFVGSFLVLLESIDQVVVVVCLCCQVGCVLVFQGGFIGLVGGGVV